MKCSYRYSSSSDTAKYHQYINQTIAQTRSTIATCATDHSSPYIFASLPHDTEYHASYEHIITTALSYAPDLLVIVGIGGSLMGTAALHEALAHHRSQPIPCIYADTVDPIITPQTLASLESALRANKKCLVCIISKSGTTLETTVNAALILDLLKRYHPTTYRDMIIAITDATSSLAHFAQHHNIQCAHIPPLLGGRFSVFSAVGMIPLTVLGHDTTAFQNGAYQAFSDSMNTPHDHAAAIAQFLFTAYQEHKTIHDWFIFAPHYRSLGLWYRQLIAESLGKRSFHQSVGITPTVSLGTEDLHSVAQLYLDGPDNETTTFIMPHCAHTFHTTIPTSELIKHMPHAATVSAVHIALYEGIIDAYKTYNKSYMNVALSCSAFDIGYLMQTYMIATVYLADLFQINAFDQPAITAYKQAAYRHLNA